MSNFNFSVLEGNLLRDPEYSKSSDGSVCKFIISSIRKIKGQEQKTSFFDITTYGKLAESCNKLRKGARVLVSGILCNDKNKLNIESREVNILSGKL
jgi:single-stranded DNA-binding protein